MIPITADLRVHDFRKETRGVFTDDLHVAGLYAQFGVPVWFVHTGTEKFWTAGGEADFMKMSPPFQCVTRIYEGSNVSYRPSHLVPLQEYQKGGATNGQGGADGDGAKNAEREADGDGAVNDDDYYDIMAQNDVDYEQRQEGTHLQRPIHETGAVASSSNLQSSSSAFQTPLPADAARKENPEGYKKRKGGPDRPADTTPLRRKRSRADALGLPKYPPTRIGNNHPTWWPEYWQTALQAVLDMPLRDAPRIRALQMDLNHPVPYSSSKGTVFASPVLEQFAGEMQPGAQRGNTSRMFRSYAALRQALVYRLTTQLACDVQRWAPKQWKDILTRHVNQPMQAQCMERLGLERQSDPATVEPGQLPVPVGLPACFGNIATLSSAPVASTSASFSPRSEIDDDDDDVAMITLHPQSVKPRYFVPLDVDATPRLGRHDERYLSEPSAWRFTGPGKQRAQGSFKFWLERDSDINSADETLEFVLAGTETRKKCVDDDCDFWWDYDHGWVFILMAPPCAEGSLLGERLTQPLRLFTTDGGGRPTFLHGTEKTPLQLRLWRSEPWNRQVDLPQVPLGAVGSRARLRWDLNDADYLTLYPTAPRLPPPDELKRITIGYANTTAHHEPASSAARSIATQGSPAQSVAHAATSSTSTQAPQRSSPQDNARERPGLPKSLDAALNPPGPIVFKGHVLPPYEPPKDDKDYVWPDEKSRARIIWDVGELAFRLELCLFDDMLRLMYRNDPKLNAQSTIERMQMLCEIWGSDSFVPDSPSPLTSQEWTQRIEPVLAFHKLASTWPRTDKLLDKAPSNGVFDSEKVFLDFELKVWKAYAITHRDYQFSEPAIPLMYPVLNDDSIPMDLS